MHHLSLSLSLSLPPAQNNTRSCSLGITIAKSRLRAWQCQQTFVAGPRTKPLGDRRVNCPVLCHPTTHTLGPLAPLGDDLGKLQREARMLKQRYRDH